MFITSHETKHLFWEGIFGEDVAFGGVFRATMDLRERHGRCTKKVRDLIITHLNRCRPCIQYTTVRARHCGLCNWYAYNHCWFRLTVLETGLASNGCNAMAEIQFADYIFPAFDQVILAGLQALQFYLSFADCKWSIQISLQIWKWIWLREAYNKGQSTFRTLEFWFIMMFWCNRLHMVLLVMEVSMLVYHFNPT